MEGDTTTEGEVSVIFGFSTDRRILQPINVIERFQHTSWASPSGVILLGGQTNQTRIIATEKIEADGTSDFSFDLKYTNM